MACAGHGKREASRFASRESGAKPSPPPACASLYRAAMPYYYGSYSPYYASAYSAYPYYSSYASPYYYGA